MITELKHDERANAECTFQNETLMDVFLLLQVSTFESANLASETKDIFVHQLCLNLPGASCALWETSADSNSSSGWYPSPLCLQYLLGNESEYISANSRLLSYCLPYVNETTAPHVSIPALRGPYGQSQFHSFHPRENCLESVSLRTQKV
jgi:hypothetical protein